MNIIVNKKSPEEIICPEYKENLFIQLEDFRIKKYKSKNNHNYGDLTFEEYNQLDFINIKCNICNNKK